MTQTVLGEMLQKKGLTGVALARSIGVADSLISHWRKGRVYVPEKYREPISKLLGVPMDELFDARGLPKLVEEPSLES